MSEIPVGKKDETGSGEGPLPTRGGMDVGAGDPGAGADLGADAEAQVPEPGPGDAVSETDEGGRPDEVPRPER